MKEPEYCPHCGSLVELRTTRGSGITRDRRFCTGNPSCRLGNVIYTSPMSSFHNSGRALMKSCINW
jgi:hypothetical protein